MYCLLVNNLNELQHLTWLSTSSLLLLTTSYRIFISLNPNPATHHVFQNLQRVSRQRELSRRREDQSCCWPESPNFIPPTFKNSERDGSHNMPPMPPIRMSDITTNAARNPKDRNSSGLACPPSPDRSAGGDRARRQCSCSTSLLNKQPMFAYRVLDMDGPGPVPP